MHAAVLHTLGKPPRFESFPDPVAEPDEAIVHVRAASLKPIDRLMASGGHYASPREFPVVCGVDGIGVLDDGTRVFFGGPRRPYGAMAERTVVARSRCWPVPESLDDATAAALLNPALSSWLPLVWRAQLAAGETVLILGATGIAGKLAVRVAKLLGTGRVVAAGRNEQALSTLGGLGADAVIHLDASDQEVTQAFAREAGNKGYDVIVDYLWGHPTELLLAALTRAEFSMKAAGPRLIPIGESAGPAISLPAAALRSAGLAILGGGFPPMNILLDAYNQLKRSDHQWEDPGHARQYRVPAFEHYRAHGDRTAPARRLQSPGDCARAGSKPLEHLTRTRAQLGHQGLPGRVGPGDVEDPTPPTRPALG